MSVFFKPWIALAVLLLPLQAAWSRPSSPEEYDWGFFASRLRDPAGSVRTRAVGPFFETALGTNEATMTAIRPVFSKARLPSKQTGAVDLLWPLAERRTVQELQRERLLVFFRYHEKNIAPQPRTKLWLFPFYFQGTSISGETYRAVFPLGGTIREFLGRDTIRFVLFPLRSTSTLDDLKTSNWLWPVYSETTGEKTYRFRVFPFYGKNVREGQFEKKFILWPIWNSVRYDHPKSSGKGFILFPLYGQMHLTDQHTWWLIPPLFRYTKGDRMDKINAPWPIIQYAREKGVPEDEAAYKLVFWPVWGHKHVGNLDETFALWPIFWWQDADRGIFKTHTFRVVPFYIDSREVSTGEGGTTKDEVTMRYNKLWPLYSYRREGEASRLWVPQLWPFTEMPAVERNWSPLWTLYARQRVGDRVESEFLWGLYRNRREGAEARHWSLFPLFEYDRENGDDYRSWSILKGLIGYERREADGKVRFLYFLKF